MKRTREETLLQEQDLKRRCKFQKEQESDDDDDDDDYSMQDVDSNDDSDSDTSITQELNELLQDDAISRETYRSMMPSSSLNTPILPLPSSTNSSNRTTTARPTTILHRSSTTASRPNTTTTTTTTTTAPPTMTSFVTRIRTTTLENHGERNWIGWLTLLVASCTNIGVVLISPSWLQLSFSILSLLWFLRSQYNYTSNNNSITVSPINPTTTTTSRPDESTATPTTSTSTTGNRREQSTTTTNSATTHPTNARNNNATHPTPPRGLFVMTLVRSPDHSFAAAANRFNADNNTNTNNRNNNDNDHDHDPILNLLRATNAASQQPTPSPFLFLSPSNNSNNNNNNNPTPRRVITLNLRRTSNENQQQQEGVIQERLQDLFQQIAMSLTAVDDRGATPEQIAALQTQTNQTQSHELPTCGICLDDHAMGDEICTLPCGHIFHSHCIHSWLQQVANCPICKQSLPTLPSTNNNDNNVNR